MEEFVPIELPVIVVYDKELPPVTEGMISFFSNCKLGLVAAMVAFSLDFAHATVFGSFMVEIWSAVGSAPLKEITLLNLFFGNCLAPLMAHLFVANKNGPSQRVINGLGKMVKITRIFELFEGLKHWNKCPTAGPIVIRYASAMLGYLIRIIPFKPNVLINVVAFSVPTAQAAGIFLGTAIPQFLAGAGGILAGMWTGVQVLHFQMCLSPWLTSMVAMPLHFILVLAGILSSQVFARYGTFTFITTAVVERYFNSMVDGYAGYTTFAAALINVGINPHCLIEEIIPLCLYFIAETRRENQRFKSTLVKSGILTLDLLVSRNHSLAKGAFSFEKSNSTTATEHSNCLSEDRYLQAKLPKPSADILAKNPSFLSSLSTSLEENFRKLKLDISRADGTEAIPTGGKTKTSGKDTGTGTDAQRRGAAKGAVKAAATRAARTDEQQAQVNKNQSEAALARTGGRTQAELDGAKAGSRTKMEKNALAAPAKAAAKLSLQLTKDEILLDSTLTDLTFQNFNTLSTVFPGRWSAGCGLELKLEKATPNFFKFNGQFILVAMQEHLCKEEDPSGLERRRAWGKGNIDQNGSPFKMITAPEFNVDYKKQLAMLLEEKRELEEKESGELRE